MGLWNVLHNPRHTILVALLFTHQCCNTILEFHQICQAWFAPSEAVYRVPWNSFQEAKLHDLLEHRSKIDWPVVLWAFFFLLLKIGRSHFLFSIWFLWNNSQTSTIFSFLFFFISTSDKNGIMFGDSSCWNPCSICKIFPNIYVNTVDACPKRGCIFPWLCPGSWHTVLPGMHGVINTFQNSVFFLLLHFYGCIVINVFLRMLV